ncbi:hypothetical protein J2T02_004200 [Chitinophaga terrae (ex Kim and Jung 2007)]|nr:hypothetical protein [Chitinophaga terrae (ex Kim and Jung 2007)]
MLVILITNSASTCLSMFNTNLPAMILNSLQPG